MSASVAVYPTAEQIQALLASAGEGPVVMVNLLRFKTHADAPNEGLSGEEAYRRYAVKTVAFVETRGGRSISFSRIRRSSPRIVPISTGTRRRS